MRVVFLIALFLLSCKDDLPKYPYVSYEDVYRQRYVTYYQDSGTYISLYFYTLDDDLNNTCTQFGGAASLTINGNSFTFFPYNDGWLCHYDYSFEDHAPMSILLRDYDSNIHEYLYSPSMVPPLTIDTSSLVYNVDPVNSRLKIGWFGEPLREGQKVIIYGRATKERYSGGKSFTLIGDQIGKNYASASNDGFNDSKFGWDDSVTLTIARRVEVLTFKNNWPWDWETVDYMSKPIKLHRSNFKE